MRHAVSILVIRHAPNVEVLWARRGDSAPFLSGFHAFPGGFVNASDMEVVDGNIEEAKRIALVRELHEETGILLAPRSFESSKQRADDVTMPDDIKSILNAWKNEPENMFNHLGDWPSPPYLGQAFTTSYFSVIDGDIQSTVGRTDGELESYEWVCPSEAISRWTRGEVLLAPPTRWLLDALSRCEDAAALKPDVSEMEFLSASPIRKDVLLIPVKTPTLPPATHTNCYLLGLDDLWLVEPASSSTSDVERICSIIDQRCAQGARLRGIVLTHHHHDHIGGVSAIMARYGVDCWAHPKTASRVKFEIKHLLNDGDLLPFRNDRVWQVLFTPGHAPGHICLFSSKDGTMIVGDMVAGVGTILVEPRDGDMALYLESLRRMTAYMPSCLLPSHGPAIGGAVHTLKRYISHRLMRESKVLNALSREPITLEVLVHDAYDDAPAFLREGLGGGLAGLSLHAHLLKLLADGLVVEKDGAWSRCSS